MPTEQAVSKVNATFKTLGTYENVLVYYPSIKNDKYLKLIPEHSIEVPGLENPIHIPSHYRRGDIIDGRFVTKHFFTKYASDELRGEKRTAEVEVVLKTDHTKNDEQTIIINISRSAVGNKPEWRLKVGTDKTPVADGYQIPGTEKFIAFEKAN